MAANRAFSQPLADLRSQRHAANLCSLIASRELHSLDPEANWTDVIRVTPYWPRERYLELSPRYWRDTRNRLDARELELPVGRYGVAAGRRRH